MIRLYKDDPTEGLTDGVLVSDGDGSSRVDSGFIIAPPAGFQNGEWVKLAIRCEDGHQTVLAGGIHAQVSIEDAASIILWQLAPDQADSPNEAAASGWGDPLNFAAPVDDTNTVFWARARATDTDVLGNDISVFVRVAASVALV